MNILVVDDDELNQRMMELLLTRLGHTVENASNGLDAFNAVKNRNYDLVFMDLQMPVMNGVESSRRIREWEKDGIRSTYIVALTASYLPDEGHILFEAGIDNYISKPFEVAHVERFLNYRFNAIRRQKLSQEIKAASHDALDTQIGIQRVGGNPVAYKELLSDFVGEVPGRIEVIQRSYNDYDMAVLSRAAHNLKGVSANLGAFLLSECADRIDKQSSEGYTEPLGDLIAEIKIISHEFMKSARGFLDG